MHFHLLLALCLSFNAFSQGNGTSFNGINHCLNKKFSIAIHVVEDTLGNTNVIPADIAKDIAGVNAYFAPICVSFDVCSTYYHPNSRNDSVAKDAKTLDVELATLYDVPMVINIYYVQKINAGGTCGFAPLGTMAEPSKTPDRDAIFINKTCAGDGGTVIHELGHYFGLYHTFETTTNGVELADGSNCATAGDLVCDTPPDPYDDPQVNSSNLDAFCDLTPPITDSNGDYLTPNTCNVMTYFTPCGGTYFTTGQYNRMLDIMLNGRKYLW